VEPPKLEDLDRAHVVPEVPRWWWRTCWGVFAFAAAMLFVGLATLATDARPAAVKVMTFVAMLATFSLAAFNTWWAANGFDKRERHLGGVLRAWSASGKSRERKAELGALSLRLDHPGNESSLPWLVIADGVYLPGAYWRPESKGSRAQFSRAGYLDLIHAETRAARTRAATLAGALGGMFVAGLQVYSKLLAEVARAAG